MNHRALVCCAVLLFVSPALAGTVQLTVEEPSGVVREQWPVTSGVPLAAGELREAREVTLVASDGHPLPLQTEVVARWPDGSVRWLLVDFQVDLAANEKKLFTLRYGPGVAPLPVERPIRVDVRNGDVAIETGPLRIGGDVWLDLNRDGQFAAEEQLTGDALAFVLTDASGRRFTASDPDVVVEVEQTGPIRACLRIAGTHVAEQRRMFRYVARIHAYRGQPWVRVCYTFINDDPDTLMAAIRSLDLVVRPSWQQAAPGTVVLDGKLGCGGRLFQVDERRYEVDGQPTGKHGCGWAAISGDKAGLAVGVREFWQNWPKSVEVEPGELRIGICPALPPGLYDGKPLEEENNLYYSLRGGVHTFKVGMARTHEFWATFFPGSADPAELAQFFRAAEEPLLATPEPRHVSASGALGDFPPADPTNAEKYCGYDAWLSRALDAHLARREQDREYGMLNFGDWYGERDVNW